MSSEQTLDNVSSSGTVNLGKYGAGAGLLGVIGLVVVLAMAITAPTSEAQAQVWGSYLYGLVFWTAISLGMFGLTALHHTVRSTWTLGVLRILEAGGGWITLTIMGLGFIPVALKLPAIYRWAVPEIVAKSPVLQHKAPFLNPTVWSIQLVLFFAFWIGASAAFRKSVLLQEKTKDFALENRRMTFGAITLLFFFLTGTFAFIDWVMSLEPEWSSTMYALWFTIGSSLGAYAISVVLFNLNADKKPFSDFVSKNVTKDQGNMLFVHTMLWGYTSLSQYLIIWNGNLPENTAYYVRRASLGWNAWGMATIIGQFFIPFFLLLSPRGKKNSANLRSIAGFMFAVHIIDYTLIVAPALPGRASLPAGLQLSDLIAWIGFGGLWLLGFSLMFQKAPAFPTYDTRMQEAKAHAH